MTTTQQSELRMALTCGHCGDEINEEEPRGTWISAGGDGDAADERRYCDVAPDHLHAPNTRQSAPRFALDEDKAASWLAASYIDDDWDPRGIEDPSSVIAEALYQAQRESVALITGPAGASIEYDDCGDENEAGYRWEVWLPRTPAVPYGLKLSGQYCKAWHIGEPGVTGPGAILPILREAVNAANSLLGDLDRHVASLPLAARAPEIADLAARIMAIRQVGPDGYRELLAVLSKWFLANDIDILAR